MGELLRESWMILAALIPSIGLLFLFWMILKHFVEGDRRERAAIRRWEAEQDRALSEGPAQEPAPDLSEKKDATAQKPEDPR